MSITYGSLFTGIGGFDLAFDRAGMRCLWQCEIDPWCCKVLEKHWPGVTRYGDIRQVDWSTVARLDVLCGGFPCQPHSLAGKRRASNDERDLWTEFYRAIRELKPKWVVAENVRGLLSSENGRFFGGILRDLAGCGYDAEWQVLSAAQFGAPHIRERVWIVAYPTNDKLLQNQFNDSQSSPDPGGHGKIGTMADATGERTFELPIRSRGSRQTKIDVDRNGADVSSPRGESLGWFTNPREECDHWRAEPSICRVANGIPGRVDRLRGLGNAIVPQIAEWIARRIVEAHA
jgi:DNA (cytosine-5)-methyltransferase 1